MPGGVPHQVSVLTAVLHHEGTHQHDGSCHAEQEGAPTDPAEPEQHQAQQTELPPDSDQTSGQYGGGDMPISECQMADEDESEERDRLPNASGSVGDEAGMDGHSGHGKDCGSRRQMTPHDYSEDNQRRHRCHERQRLHCCR